MVCLCVTGCHIYCSFIFTECCKRLSERLNGQPMASDTLTSWLPMFGDVLKFLSSRRILYLNWCGELHDRPSTSIFSFFLSFHFPQRSAKSILTSSDLKSFRLADFSCGVTLDSRQLEEEEMLEDLQKRIPPFIAPPEVRLSDHVIISGYNF